jgi:hypothetical protein
MFPLSVPIRAHPRLDSLGSTHAFSGSPELSSRKACTHSLPILPVVLYLARLRTGLNLRKIGIVAGQMDDNHVSTRVRRFKKRRGADRPPPARNRQAVHEEDDE